jgi:hypothetical protein
MLSSFGERVINYYQNLHFGQQLPKGIHLLNPYRDHPAVMESVKAFYTKFYNDHHPRTLILGINPGRLGAGATGIPFTDTKRLKEICGLDLPGVHTHEPSSVLVYELIAAYGGTEKFYKQFYINSVCPLGFTATNARGREVNHNYYDTPALQQAVLPFIEWNIQTQIDMGCRTDTCFCLGTGKNYAFLSKLNGEKGYFKRVTALEHPRYVVQYKQKQKEEYIRWYLEKLNN